MPNFDLDPKLIRKLADLLNETGLTEIEYADGDKRVRVTKAAIQSLSVAQAPASLPIATLPTPANAQTPAAPAVNSADAVTSPMVGMAYLQPEPGAAPFVRPGDTVKAGQTLLVIEAMKVMNPIKAPKAGTVQQIMVTDAKPVEFGEPLMLIA